MLVYNKKSYDLDWRFLVKRKTRILIRAISWLLFILYLIGISYFMFFSERFGRTGSTEEYHYNLVLFREIRRFITYRKEIGFEGFIVNIFGNVLAFAPYGFCLPMLSNKDNRLFRVLIATFCFSLLIECIQLFYKIGCFDVDDLLLNTLGGVLGFFAYRFCRWLFRKYHARNRKKQIKG